MDETTKIIIVVVAAGIFYFRLVTLQWGKAKKYREANEELARQASVGKKKKNQPAPPPAPTLTFQISSWPLVGIGVALVIIGMLMNLMGANVAAWLPGWWWLPTAAGLVVMSFSFK
ncbi:MAG TPA: hypothetical protein PKW33_19185 [Anaerolineaceae bacterium]|nr:hypothetical protein [Anaerolineaceae bacterium]HPN53727.1 hypothetical protein [Anaerolineaceae bacterium]